VGLVIGMWEDTKDTATILT